MLSKIALLVNCFFTGATILGYEILMVYILTPYFGASHIVWTNVIATVIFSLAIGYKFGGSLSDRYPHYRTLYTIILLGCCLFMLAYICHHIVCTSIITILSLIPISYHWSVFFSSLIVSLLLFCLPILLLGCSTPYIIRLLLTSMKKVGQISGLVYGISTIGSLVGITVTSLLFLPLFGLKTTITLLTLCLIIVSSITWGLTNIK